MIGEKKHVIYNTDNNSQILPLGCFRCYGFKEKGKWPIGLIID